MSQKNFNAIYFPSDFTSLIGGLGGLVNLATLQVEIAAAMPTTDVLVQLVAPNTVQVLSSSFPPGSEITALDAAIAAHTGLATTSNLQPLTSDSDTVNSTTVYAPKQTGGIDDVLVSQPMNGGVYGLSATGRLVSSAQVAGVGIGVILRATTGGSISAANEQPHTEASFASSVVPQLYTMVDTIQLAQGAILRVQFTFKRLGGASGSVTARHVRLRLAPL